MILTGTSAQVMAAEEAKVNKDEVEVIQVTGIPWFIKGVIKR